MCACVHTYTLTRAQPNMYTYSHKHTMQIGGSNAQQDMFQQTYLDVLLKTNNVGVVKPLLEERIKVWGVVSERVGVHVGVDWCVRARFVHVDVY